jgi:hypothetical protein
VRRHALAAALLAPVLLAPLAGCAQSVDPIERLSKKAAQRVRPHAAPGPALPQVVGHIPTRKRVVFLTHGGTPIPGENTDHLTPGAVIRTDPSTTPALLRTIQRQGFTVEVFSGVSGGIFSPSGV